MSSEEFISLLNGKLEGQTMQIIPAYSFHELPPTPFATWSVTDSNFESYTVLDRRETIGTNVQETAKFYKSPVLTIKTYSYDRTGAQEEAQKLYKNIKFGWREAILTAGYGIIEVTNEGESPEKQANGQYLNCYVIKVTIDFENKETRLTPELKKVILTGDVEKTIDII